MLDDISLEFVVERLADGAIDGSANNWLLVIGASADRIGVRIRLRPKLPRSSSRKATGSVIAAPRSSSAAHGALAHRQHAAEQNEDDDKKSHLKSH